MNVFSPSASSTRVNSSRRTNSLSCIYIYIHTAAPPFIVCGVSPRSSTSGGYQSFGTAEKGGERLRERKRALLCTGRKCLFDCYIPRRWAQPVPLRHSALPPLRSAGIFRRNCCCCYKDYGGRRRDAYLVRKSDEICWTRENVFFCI